jgi:hypothetical protein
VVKEREREEHQEETGTEYKEKGGKGPEIEKPNKGEETEIRKN